MLPPYFARVRITPVKRNTAEDFGMEQSTRRFESVCAVGSDGHIIRIDSTTDSSAGQVSVEDKKWGTRKLRFVCVCGDPRANTQFSLLKLPSPLRQARAPLPLDRNTR